MWTAHSCSSAGKNQLSTKEALRLKILERSRLKKENGENNNNNVKLDNNDKSNCNNTYDNDNNKVYKSGSNDLEHQIDKLKNIFVLNINQINENITKFAKDINNRLLNLESRVDKLEARQ